MLIKSKYSINKINYEKFGQQCFFGRDNIILKTVNLPKKHKYQSLCSKFKIKILIGNLYCTAVDISCIVINTEASPAISITNFPGLAT